MANFDESYDITLKHEGGYSNDSADSGGETFIGISRKHHPDWAGWEIIDNAKSESNFPNNLRGNAKLDEMIHKFYKNHYWNRFWGDQIPNQDVANEIFDTGVNMGVGRAVKYLQKGLNVLNRNQKNYGDIVEDGDFGNTTLGVLNSYLREDDPIYLLKVLKILRGWHYISYMRKSPLQEKFARGWLSRINL